LSNSWATLSKISLHVYKLQYNYQIPVSEAKKRKTQEIEVATFGFEYVSVATIPKYADLKHLNTYVMALILMCVLFLIKLHFVPIL